MVDPLIDSALIAWKKHAGQTATLPSTNCSSRQRAWDLPCCVSSTEYLSLTLTDATDRARLLAVQAPGSGEWLEALPLSAIGLKLDDQSVRIAISLRLGAPIVGEHRCICGALVKENGHHGLSCVRSSGRQSRHSSVNDIIHRALLKADIAAVREPTYLCATDDRRPDGVTLVPWSKGKCAIWDFTCPDTLAPSHLAATSLDASSAANSAEELKAKKYADLTTTYDVIPISVETLGTWGKSGRSFIDNVGARIAQITQEPRSAAFLRQRIAIAVQRGNAISILGTHRHLT
jgi:hypothetical protein